MGSVTLMLPRLGETMEEAKVTEWIVAPGKTYARGDVLLEVETDKTVVEVPALADGRLIAQLVATGDIVALDAPIAEVEQDGEPPRAEQATAAADAADARSEMPGTAAPDGGTPVTGAPDDGTPVTGAPERPAASGPRPSGDRIAASPAARAAARRQGTPLSGITGTGRRGRITAEDVAQHGGTVVLLHGLFDTSAGWRSLPRRLAQRGLACVTLDLPGHGDDTSVATSFDAAVDQVAARLPQGPLHLVGHSLGGALATRLAASSGVDAVSLTLFAPIGLGAAISADFLDEMGNATTLEALRQALSFLDGGPVSDAAIAQQLPHHTTGLAGRVALAQSVATDGFQTCDVTADIASVPCPVTVLFGTSDRILDWRDVAHLPAETRIHLIPNAGHLPHLVRPDLAAALIASRLDLAKGI